MDSACMRKNLEIVNYYRSQGIDFVVVPVISEESKAKYTKGALEKIKRLIDEGGPENE